MLTEQESLAKLEKWRAVIDHPDLPPIKDAHRRLVTAMVLENTERDLREAGSWAPGSQRLLGEAPVPANFMGTSSSTAGAGGIDTFDPILISMVRRSVPNLIAYDLVGVQPMTGPTGLIFAMRVRQSNQAGTETWYNEVNTPLSTVSSGANTLGQKQVGTLPGNTTVTSNLAAQNLYNF